MMNYDCDDEQWVMMMLITENNKEQEEWRKKGTPATRECHERVMCITLRCELFRIGMNAESGKT